MNRETLTTSEMMNISGGDSREEYCKTLMKIVMENDLDDGAMEGARHGYEKFNCAEFL